MKIYLASRYSRRQELCQYRHQLEAIGHTVTSRWLNGSHQISDAGTPIGDTGEALVEGDDGDPTAKAAALRCTFAQEDILDLLAAHVVVSFTEPPRSAANRGGRHVEFGYALACTLDGLKMGTGQRFRLIVVGHRENLFHWLPVVEFFETWAGAKEALHN